MSHVTCSVDAGSCSAVGIQAAIDRVAATGGGRVVLPAIDVTLDRGLELRSGVELCGQGADTVLRKGPGQAYPLTGYHNYGMHDVPLTSTAGLQPGMTVSVLDARKRGFHSTLARIVWVEDGWVGLDRGLESDYAEEAVLTTAHPLIFGHGVRRAAVRRLRLEGNRGANPMPMDACRGAAIYLARSADCEVEAVFEADFAGEGLGFQMCRDIRIRGCRFDGNLGNGLHPGAGSTNALFEDCQAEGNLQAGFFFCVRATRITVRGCTFRRNGRGLSIGTRDCRNLVEDCVLQANRGPGILTRAGSRPTEVHSVLVRRCEVTDNGTESGAAQIAVEAAAHDLIVEKCRLRGAVGIQLAAGVQRVFLTGLEHEGENSVVDAGGGAVTSERPSFGCGYGEVEERDFRHLGMPN